MGIKRPLHPDDEISEEASSPAMHRLNLNLLYPLHAILHAPSLTEAGRRVRLSQSAMSHALKRLREHFSDDLVTHTGATRNLTPLGLALRDEVRRVMQEVEGTFNFALDFDPATSTQTITIATPEEIEQMLLRPVIRQLASQAPGMSVKLLPLAAAQPHLVLDDGADLLMISENYADPQFETLHILNDHASCLVCADHAVLGDGYETTADRYRAARHVVPHGEVSSSLAVTKEGFELLEARRIAVQATSQATLPAMVIGSDLVATGSSWLFQYYASIMPVRTVSAPFPTRETAYVAQWAPHRKRDPMLVWLLNLIQEQARYLAPNQYSEG